MIPKKLRKEIIAEVYLSRQDRSVHPEGEFDDGGRWYPSNREDCGGDGTCVRSPSRKWPYSYLVRCRRKQHCAVLVEALIAGKDVPEDVMEGARRVLVRLGWDGGAALGIVRDYLMDGCPALETSRLQLLESNS